MGVTRAELIAPVGPGIEVIVVPVPPVGPGGGIGDTGSGIVEGCPETGVGITTAELEATGAVVGGGNVVVLGVANTPYLGTGTATGAG